MPELPEVETTRRHLVPILEGHRLDAVHVARDRMVRRQPRPRDFVDRSEGRCVERVGRRGKFLLWRLEGDLTTVVHLGMSGRVQVVEPTAARVPHTNVTWQVGSNEVRLVDPRTFGFVACLTDEELDEMLADIGPDALIEPPNAPALADRLAGRTAPIKALLLDQRLVSGLGNIYADEVLHRAGVDPRRAGGTLDTDEVGRLVGAIGPVLERALVDGGTSLDDLAYLLPDGRAGEYTARLAVYGRHGEHCRTCGSEISRTLIAQRSTHWCPNCQR